MDHHHHQHNQHNQHNQRNQHHQHNQQQQRQRNGSLTHAQSHSFSHGHPNAPMYTSTAPFMIAADHSSGLSAGNKRSISGQAKQASAPHHMAMRAMPSLYDATARLNEPPQKRTRLVSALSTQDEVIATVMALNNHNAMKFFAAGDYARAESCFLHAMSILNEHCLQFLTASSLEALASSEQANNTACASVGIHLPGTAAGASNGTTNGTVTGSPHHQHQHQHQQQQKSVTNEQRRYDFEQSKDTSASGILSATSLLELLNTSNSAVASASTSASATTSTSTSMSKARVTTCSASMVSASKPCVLSSLLSIEATSLPSSLSWSLSSTSKPTSKPTPAVGAASRMMANEQSGESKKSTYHYDEGMHMYKDVMPLSAEIYRLMIDNGGAQATYHAMGFMKFAILYNIGQTCIHRNEFEKAEQWFHQALVECNASSSIDTTTALLKLLHNLGYCAFRRNRNLVAIKSYENALNIAKSLMDTQQRCEFIASSLNCVAVMKFVQHPQKQATLESANMLQHSRQIYKLLLEQQHQREQQKKMRAFHTDQQPSIFAFPSSFLPSSTLSSSNSFSGTNAPSTPNHAFNAAAEFSASEPLKCDDIISPEGNTVSAASRYIAMATVLNNLGRVYYFNRSYNQALGVYTECLQLRQRYLPRDSLDIAVTIYNLGQTHHQLNKSDEALECYKVFRSMILDKLPFESRDVAIVHKCMAELYHERNELERCHECLEQSLSAARACLGPFHAEVASILNKIGNVCYELGMYDAAMKYYKQGLEIERVVLGACHPHTVVTMVNIAHIHKQQKNFRQALRLYSQVRSIQATNAQSEGEADDATTSSHGNADNNINDNNTNINDTASANGGRTRQQRRRRRRSQERQRRANIDEATSLSNMGLMQYNLKDYRGAFESYQEALRIRRDYYESEDHADIASTLNSIGLTLFKQRMYGLAQQCFAQCLKIRKSLLGDDHRDVAVVWYNMGTIHFEQGEDDDAVACYRETLRVEEIALGKYHCDVVMTLQHIGQVHQQIGRFDDAMQFLMEAKRRDIHRIALQQADVDGDEDGDMETGRPTSEKDVFGLAKIHNLIGNLHLQQGQVKEMMVEFTEALRLVDAYHSDNPAVDGSSTRRSGMDSLLIAGYNFYGLSKTNPPAAPVA